MKLSVTYSTALTSLHVSLRAFACSAGISSFIVDMTSQCRIIHVSNHFFIFFSLCASVVLQFVDCFQAIKALFTRDFIFITSLPLNSKYFKTTEYDAERQAPPPPLYRTAQFCYMCLLTQCYSCRLVQETFREQL